MMGNFGLVSMTNLLDLVLCRYVSRHIVRRAQAALIDLYFSGHTTHRDFQRGAVLTENIVTCRIIGCNVFEVGRLLFRYVSLRAAGGHSLVL